MRVWNMRDTSTPASAVRVDRATRWGNPFVIGKDGDRAAVVELYRRYLWEQMNHPQTGASFRESMLTELEGRDLRCWCAPEPCHGDVLIRAIAWLRKEGE